ncbi:non-homologous end-joining DNA ligase [Marinobacter sp.]|uniref:non-homologous end-joining DNA ligase n=1 Tax=Marinobacter sp. TaxID=50741 RepID=UPI00384B44BF
MTDWKDSLNGREKDRLRKTSMPEKVEPMLATLTEDYFSKEDWLFEPKLDGERCLTFHDGKSTNLYSRKPRLLNKTYPELRDALEEQSLSFVADGEVVAFEGDVTRFSRLQKRMQIRDEDEARASDIAVYYYLFDLLYLDGYDLSDLPLRTRKRLLRDVIEFSDPVRFTRHRDEEGEKFLEEACKNGMEGVIAKDAESPYRKGRSRKWLKFKCVNQQELVVVGYTDPEGERTGFGSLVLGYYRQGKLCYAGRVGTGFDEDTLEFLHEKLQKRERKTSPLDEGGEEGTQGVHWVKPELVAEIGFTEWTEDGRLRHPRYLGLRDDKAPEDVTREQTGDGS